MTPSFPNFYERRWAADRIREMVARSAPCPVALPRVMPSIPVTAEEDAAWRELEQRAATKPRSAP